jgi:hypothetical protein
MSEAVDQRVVIGMDPAHAVGDDRSDDPPRRPWSVMVGSARIGPVSPR